MRLRTKPTFIRVGEQEMPRKKKNIDKYVYIGILIIILIVGLWRMSRTIFYVTGYGQIMLPKVEIQPINDVRILKYYVKEAQEVKQRDVLYTYVESEVGSITYSRLLWQLVLKRKEKTYYEGQLNKKKEDFERMKRMVLLETYLPYNIKNLGEEIEKTKFQIIKIDAEISNINQEIIASGIQHFNSPLSGTVTRIYYEEKEVVLKGQTIMNIYKIGEIKIKAFFEQKDIGVIKKDKIVIIEFPDKTKKEGIVTNVYFATLPQPPEFQKKYESVHRSIIADIIPFQYEVEPFEGLYKMSVKIYVPKFSRGGNK